MNALARLVIGGPACGQLVVSQHHAFDAPVPREVSPFGPVLTGLVETTTIRYYPKVFVVGSRAFRVWTTAAGVDHVTATLALIDADPAVVRDIEVTTQGA